MENDILLVLLTVEDLDVHFSPIFKNNVWLSWFSSILHHFNISQKFKYCWRAWCSLFESFSRVDKTLCCVCNAACCVKPIIEWTLRGRLSIQSITCEIISQDPIPIRLMVLNLSPFTAQEKSVYEYHASRDRMVCGCGYAYSLQCQQYTFSYWRGDILYCVCGMFGSNCKWGLTVCRPSLILRNVMSAYFIVYWCKVTFCVVDCREDDDNK